MTVRAKLTILTVGLIGAGLACMGFALHVQLYSNLLGEIDRQLQSETNSVVADNGGNPNLRVQDSGPELKVESAREEKVVQVLRTRSAGVYLESRSPLPKLIPLGKLGENQQAEDPAAVTLAANTGPVFHMFMEKGAPMRSLTVPVPKVGKPIGVVQAIRSLAGVRQEMANLDLSLEMLIPLATALSALFGAAFVAFTMRPIKRLVESANELAPDLSGSRLPVSGRDEFAQLAQTMNGALDRTARAFERQRAAMAQLERFTGDAGHELRTPLAAIKGNASHLLHKGTLPEDSLEAVRSVDRSADRMAKLIDDLLLLARQDGGHALAVENHPDLGTLIAEAREELAEPANLEVTVAVCPNLSLRGDSDALRRVFLNLWSNPFAYARSRVDVEAQRVGDNIEVSFADDGEGIPPDQLERLGERFYRPDSARSRALGGTGLGLAIVRSLCIAHGGCLRISSRVGVGTTATAVFPATR